MGTLCYHCMRESMKNGRCTLCGAHESNASSEGNLELAPGTRLDGGNIIVGDTLGSGGFGITYIALDRRYGRIALKEYAPRYMLVGRKGNEMVVHPDKREVYDKCLRNFCRESRLLNQLRHPNIVHVLFELSENGTAYYGMELLNGETLAHFIRTNGPMSAAEVCNLLLPIMDALIYLHRMKTLHRDISPDNIFLRKSADGRVSPCLIDFGAAFTTLRDFTQTVPNIKKKGYSPFEQNWDRRYQGPFTDVYAFCATLYYAMTQKVPCPVYDRMQDNRDVLMMPSQLNSGIPKAVDQVIVNGMALLPQDRTQDMMQLKSELCRAVGISGVKAGEGNLQAQVSQNSGTSHTDQRGISSVISQEEKVDPNNEMGTAKSVAALLLDWLILWALPAFPMALLSSVPVGLMVGGLVSLIVNGLMLFHGGTLGQQLMCLPSVKRELKEAILYDCFRLIIPLALYMELSADGTGNKIMERQRGKNEAVVEDADESFGDSSSNTENRRSWLYAIEGCHKGSRIELRDPLTFGRDSKFAIVKFPEKSSTISQRHCVIRYQENGWHICDMHSRNGTYLNDKRLVAGEVSDCLKNGDRIKIGGEIFLFKDE